MIPSNSRTAAGFWQLGAFAARIRSVTRRAAWEKPLPADQCVVFPGYANLRAMSKVRREIVRANIGLGWPTYFRFGNFRMLFQHDPNHPESPRELTWSSRDRAFAYQKDWDFIGGFVHVFQIYGKWLQ